MLDFQEMIVQKTKSQAKKSAALGGPLLRLFWVLKYNHSLEVQNLIYTYLTHLMEHIHVEAQLCMNLSNFREILNIDIVINLSLGTNLNL